MKIFLLIALCLSWMQGGGPSSLATHLRFKRAIEVPPGSAGQTCAVLDAQVFANMASRSGDDLRVFREGDADTVEVPYTLTESGAEPSEPQPAMVQEVAIHGDTLEFDLAMPHEAYTAVELQLAAGNFIAEATVTGLDRAGGPPHALGTFTLFDFTREHLARSTALALAESRLPLLHVSLRLHGAVPTAAMIAGATVPPSREAQTLYTTVATADHLETRENGLLSVAELRVPAHVPVEGVRFELDPAWRGDFLRSVTVQGRSSLGGSREPRETVEGEVWRVTRPAAGDGTLGIDAAKLAFEAVIAVNLRTPATIAVLLKNGPAPVLPVRRVSLVMRQRMVCFLATLGARYTLRYGDAALHPPVYTVGPLDGSPPFLAALGAEMVNADYAPGLTRWHAAQGRPQTFWIGLLTLFTLVGSLALHRVRHERKRG